MLKNYIDAAIFDLDGVVTDTAKMHCLAWKETIDNYLIYRNNNYNENNRLFDINFDYINYFDGKPRYKGVEDFFNSRQIAIPFGSINDKAEADTICAIGNIKNSCFNAKLNTLEIDVYHSTVLFINHLKELNVPIGLASSSKNCEKVIEKSNLANLFDTTIDGIISEKLQLKGKPSPEIFLRTAEILLAKPERSVIIEDAVAGVKAGRLGNFGLIIGVARNNNAEELYNNGADIVVTDLSEINALDVENWFKTEQEKDNWSLKYHYYNKETEKTTETLTTIGNGFIAVRGAINCLKLGEFNYPATYIAGLYNKLETHLFDKIVENEDIVNIPNSLFLNFAIDNNELFKLNNCKLEDYIKELNLKNGELTVKFIAIDSKNRKTKVQFKRVVSMKNKNILAANIEITPLNYDSNITIESAIDTNILNNGVDRYKQFNNKHIELINNSCDSDTFCSLTKTTYYNTYIAISAKHLISSSNNNKIIKKNDLLNSIQFYTCYMSENETIKLDKVICIHTLQCENTEQLIIENKTELNKFSNYNEVKEVSETEWHKIWRKIDIKIAGDRYANKLIRLHLFHSIVSASPNTINSDISFPARGLHGEAYRGHIFWDELFILPFYAHYFPEVAKSSLMYRYNRLEESKKNAASINCKGALFPWQSAKSGKEETQKIHLNPLNNVWYDDNSYLQRHVSLAIAFNIWNYFTITNDKKFIENYGSEMYFEICKFWVSIINYDNIKCRNSINQIMGPDEFHEKYPNNETKGINNNAYTNLMVMWLINNSFKIFELSSISVLEKLKISMQTISNWYNLACNLYLNIDENGIIEQFENYFQLNELNSEYYATKYKNLQRMDRILTAENDSPNNYKIAKQADLLMLLFNFSKNKVSKLIEIMNYKVGNNFVLNNFDYYFNRTSHGSTLSKLVHAKIANDVNNYELAWSLFYDCLLSDINDNQGGTVKEGIHFGLMTGTVMLLINSFAGISVEDDKIIINPKLPTHWNSVIFKIFIKNNELDVHINKTEIRILALNNKRPIDLIVNGENYQIFEDILIVKYYNNDR